MTKKHGAYWDSNARETIFFWMGEEIKLEDFNERLRTQLESAATDLDWMLKGSELTAQINEGEKTVAKLEEVEKIAKLPLCNECRKLIGEMPA